MVVLSVEDDDYKPSNAPLELGTHIATKGLQAGAFLGTCAAGPLIGYRTYKKVPVVPAVTTLRCAGYGAMGVGALTVGMAAYKLSVLSQDGIEDRAYRLHYNLNQKRTDKFCAAGAGAGLGAAALLHFFAPGYLKMPLMQMVVGMAAVGSSAGLLVHVATAPEKAINPKTMIKEL